VLDCFFAPRSIAVVGAADDPSKLRGKLLKIALDSGFDGPVHPVHPKGGTIQGHQAYASLADIPGGADLVLIATPGATVPGVVREAVAAGARGAVILSSGVDMAELKDAIGDSGLRYMGPNCEGYIALEGPAASFAAMAEKALAEGKPPRRPGRRVSIVSQSGGLGFALFGRGRHENIDFHAVITTGNEGDLECLDFVDYLLDEGETGVVVMFIEGLKTPSRFAEVAAKAADKGVPIVIMKVGRSEAGQRAAVSHTAHLTGADTAYDAMFARYGVIRVFDQEQMLASAAALARYPHVPVHNVGVISTSGGAGAWAADLCGAEGLDVPVLSAALQQDLSQWIPEFGSTANPVDVTANAVEAGGAPLVHVLERLQHSPEVDGFIVNIGLHAPGRIAKLAELLGPVFRGATKPILFTSHIMPEPGNLAELARLGGQGFASYTACAAALKAIGGYAEFLADWRKRPASAAPTAPQLPDLAPGVLDEAATTALVKAYGIPVPPTALAGTAGEAASAAEEMGFPVVLKIQSPDIAHKTEAGGVRLGVQAGEVEEAFATIMANARAYAPDARIEGILIQKMMPKGHEIVIGVNRDPDFGPLVMLGAGGIYLEVLKDVVFAPPPISPDDALRMIRSLKTGPILEGVRGQGPADLDALAQLISRVAELARSEPAIDQLDFNPVFVYPAGEGVVAVDALAVAGGPDDGKAGHH